MNYKFEKATMDQAGEIWQILAEAIVRRKADGSNQWQDGYPNLEVVKSDLSQGYGYVLMADQAIAGYCAILINDEPAYEYIEGAWLSAGDFVVFHRVAVAKQYLGKGIARLMLGYIDEFALKNNIFSVRADTNFDNLAMLALFEKTVYHYCGVVHFRGSPRKAFEKLLRP